MNMKKFCYVTTRIVKILLVSLAVAIPLVCALVYTKNATENWSNTTQIGTYWLPEKYVIIQERPEAKIVFLNGMWEFEKLCTSNTTVHVQIDGMDVFYYISVGGGFVSSHRIRSVGWDDLGMTITDTKPVSDGQIEFKMKRSYITTAFGIFFSTIGGLIIVGMLALIRGIFRITIFEKVWDVACGKFKFCAYLNEEFDRAWNNRRD